MKMFYLGRELMELLVMAGSNKALLWWVRNVFVLVGSQVKYCFGVGIQVKDWFGVPRP